MKKLLVLVIIGVMLMGGCASYNKNTMVRVKADKAKVPIEGLGVIEGEGIEAVFSRQVNLTTERGRQVTVEQIQGDHSTNVGVR